MPWLKKEARGKETLWLIAGTAVFGLILTSGIATIVQLLGVNLPRPVSDEYLRLLLSQPPGILLVIIAGAAALEEIIFRLPLAIFVWRGWPMPKLLIAAAIFSATFGLAHGSIYNIAIQGMTGFMWSLLFLKCGGYRGKYGKALLATTASHALFNTIAFVASGRTGA